VFAVVVAAMGLGAATRVGAGPNLVTNGDFETPALDPGGFPAVTIPGWVVNGTPTVISYGAARSAPVPLGAQSLDLNSSGPATISQDLTTTPGTTYHVSFAVSGVPATPDAECPASQSHKTLTVTAGAIAHDFAFDPEPGAEPSDPTFVTEEFDFVASGATTTLALQSTTPGCAGPIVDAVAVTELAGAPAAPAPVQAVPAFTG
jgi:hypothetical protein